MTAGGAEVAGWRGVVRGLAVCRGLVTDLWEPMLPKRDKARSNVVLWLGERLAPSLAKLGVSLAEADDIRASAQLAEELDRAMAEKLGDSFPGIRGLLSATRARVRDIPEPPPVPSTESVDASERDNDEPPPPEPGGGVQLSPRSEDAGATTRRCGEGLVALARSLTLADPTRAWAYRLHRQGIWLPFEVVLVEGGALATPGPDTLTVERLRDLLATTRWNELVVAAEEASARHPLWLDAQRLTGVALERLGTPFTAAREAVGREASDFARRNGFLLESRFADGTRVASSETVEWLEAEARRWHLGSRAADVGRDEDRGLAVRFVEAGEPRGGRTSRRGARHRRSARPARVGHPRAIPLEPRRGASRDERERPRGREAHPGRARRHRGCPRPRDLGPEPLRTALRGALSVLGRRIP